MMDISFMGLGIPTRKARRKMASIASRKTPRSPEKFQSRMYTHYMA